MASERITTNHEKMGGLPCIRDLRIPEGAVQEWELPHRTSRRDR